MRKIYKTSLTSQKPVPAEQWQRGSPRLISNKTELGFINAFADCCGFSLCTFLFVWNTIRHFDTGQAQVEITFTIYIMFSLPYNRGRSSEPRPGKCLAFSYSCSCTVCHHISHHRSECCPVFAATPEQQSCQLTFTVPGEGNLLRQHAKHASIHCKQA